MAVAEPSRWRIVRLLGEGGRTVTQLAEETGLSVAATCRHLQRLRAVGIVEADRRGKELLCRPAGRETAVGRWLEDLLGAHFTGSASSRGRLTPAAPARTTPGARRPGPRPARARAETPPRPPTPSRELEDFLL